MPNIYRDYIDSKVTTRIKQHTVKNEYQRRADQFVVATKYLTFDF